MKLTLYGLREWLSAAVIALALIMLFAVLFSYGVIEFAAMLSISFIILVCWAALAAFFRDPTRKIPASPLAVVSPADGVIRDIELVKGEFCDSAELRELFDGKDLLRIGIFLSVFDVHLNRSPVDMDVRFKAYKMGAYHDARDPRAGKENEAMTIGGVGKLSDLKFPVAVRQISGAIARRIVCPVEAGDSFERGERYGMIKFGSRTELYLPAGKCFELQVQVGDRVYGGTSVLAEILPDATKECKSFLHFMNTLESEKPPTETEAK